MKAVRQFGIVLLLLVSYLTPAMACMVSGIQMNAEERACCLAMKSQCDQLGMTTSHGCCQKTPQAAHASAIVGKTVNYYPIAIAVAWLTVSEWFRPTLIGTGVRQLGYSPPQSPPNSIIVLRI